MPAYGVVAASYVHTLSVQNAATGTADNGSPFFFVRILGYGAQTRQRGASETACRLPSSRPVRSHRAFVVAACAQATSSSAAAAAASAAIHVLGSSRTATLRPPTDPTSSAPGRSASALATAPRPFAAADILRLSYISLARSPPLLLFPLSAASPLTANHRRFLLAPFFSFSFFFSSYSSSAFFPFAS
ncbi:hypothetical protein CDD83_445 [Cordyceps sp. RAO-2017]|nr:hypothetical protein CDD83_445 [Cordyceps sp. RAO-2017]